MTTHTRNPFDRRRRRRSGFTLLETVVAILLIDVGLLALAAGSAVLVRQSAQRRARATALHIAANRLETLGASGCAAASGDSVLTDGTRERWTSAPVGNAVHELRDSVTFTVAGTKKSLALRTRLPC